MTGGATKKNYSINLSANVVIGGSVIPLTTEGLDLSKPAEGNGDGKLPKNLSFGMPKDVTVSSDLGAVQQWMDEMATKVGDTTGITLPPFLTGLLEKNQLHDKLEEVCVTISSFNINTAGHFDIAFVVHFDKGLDDLLGLPEGFKKVFDIQDVGIAFTYDKPTNTSDGNHVDPDSINGGDV